jgi:peptide chain release factor 3
LDEKSLFAAFFTIFTSQIKNTMFQKLVAIEPVSLVLSAEKALYSFADEVVMYSDIPAGDIIGLPDNGTFKIGDTLTEGEKLHFRGIPSFSPEMFKYIENADPMKQKQLAKGIDQLMDEGVAQLFINQFNGRKIIGTVGQLQFEVIQYRLENEYNAKCRWEPISLYKACWVESDDPEELEAFKKRKYQYMAKDREGRDVFLADSNYVLQMAQMDFKHIKFHFTSEF